MQCFTPRETSSVYIRQEQRVIISIFTIIIIIILDILACDDSSRRIRYQNIFFFFFLLQFPNDRRNDELFFYTAREPFVRTLCFFIGKRNNRNDLLFKASSLHNIHTHTYISTLRNPRLMYRVVELR